MSVTHSGKLPDICFFLFHVVAGSVHEEAACRIFIRVFSWDQPVEGRRRKQSDSGRSWPAVWSKQWPRLTCGELQSWSGPSEYPWARVRVMGLNNPTMSSCCMWTVPEGRFDLGRGSRLQLRWPPKKVYSGGSSVTLQPSFPRSLGRSSQLLLHTWASHSSTSVSEIIP